jgi:predicted  nucleic acid-binding Zn ribbon protein
MLYSDLGGNAGPVICGKCGQSVPLCKLPYSSDSYEHVEVVNWNAALQNVYQNYSFGLSTPFNYRQMNKANSELAKEGRDICKGFETATKIPFYYHLYFKKAAPKLCPGCSSDWKLREPNILIGYKCEACRLVARDRGFTNLALNNAN